VNTLDTLDTLLVVLLCIGTLLGIIYGIILWQKKGMHVYANRFLSVILLFFAYQLLSYS